MKGEPSQDHHDMEGTLEELGDLNICVLHQRPLFFNQVNKRH